MGREEPLLGPGEKKKGNCVFFLLSLQLLHHSRLDFYVDTHFY